jgi:RimJ/RimL family protein N-acetyltransferase
MSDIWPLFGLEIQTERLVLRPMTEPWGLQLAEEVPADLEMDPGMPPLTGMSEERARQIITLQRYWTAYGNWSVESWRLPFAVFHGDDLIGEQTLEGTKFPLVREVDSASFLRQEARGKGFGKDMRRAVLALAFGPMGAESAISGAWHDNHASLGVSQAMGYELNGRARHAHGNRVSELVNVRLSRERWERSGLAEGVEFRGFEPCRELFGLSGDAPVP